MPSNLKFHSYLPKNATSTKSKKTAIEKGLLLHSSTHRNLDYTAREEERGSKPLLNHYIGIYDPQTGKLQVIEAKKMVVRGAVRSKQVATEQEGKKVSVCFSE